jgi:hypothetical protein
MYVISIRIRSVREGARLEGSAHERQSFVSAGKSRSHLPIGPRPRSPLEQLQATMQSGMTLGETRPC